MKGSWPYRLIHQKCFLSLVCILHVLLLGYSACCHSPVTDEIAHLAAGIGHWKYGDYELYNVNPPLTRSLASLPICLTNSWQTEWDALYGAPGSTLNRDGSTSSTRKEFTVGYNFLEKTGAKYFWWITLARWACIPISVLGGYVCFLWAGELYGIRAGYLAAWLWFLSPYVLTFGAMITPDVSSGTFGVLALYRYWKWTQTGQWSDAYLSGVTIGLAELTKSTWIVLHPMLTIVCVVHFFSGRLGTNRWRAFAQWGLLSFVGWFVLLAGYGFHDQFRPLGDFQFSAHVLQLREKSSVDVDEIRVISDNRFRGTWLGNMPVPLPTEFVRGVDTQETAMAAESIVAYLRGELRRKGWWYYYLYALLVKSTAGGLALFLVSTMYRVWRPGAGKPLDELLLLVFPTILFLVLLSYHTGLNRHCRYVLQFLPLCMIWTSQSAHIFRFQPIGRIFILTCMITSSVSSLLCYPHTLSYFNEFAGGPRNGGYHLSGSNVDWGHNMFYLRDEILRHNWDSVGLNLRINYDPKYAGIAAKLHAPPLSPKFQSTVSIQSFEQLKPGPYAVSLSMVQGSLGVPKMRGLSDSIDNGYTYFSEFQPIGTVGYSVLLYDISEQEIANSVTWGPYAMGAQPESISDQSTNPHP